MTRLRFAARAFRRDVRSGELAVLMLAVVVAVTAMTAVGFFIDRVAGAMQAQASEVLAADLVIRSAARPDPAFLAEARALGLETAETLVFPTVVMTGVVMPGAGMADGQNTSRTTLATVDAVSAGYPLRGHLTISDALFGNGIDVAGAPPRGEAWADAGLIGRLDLEIGDPVTVGELTLRVTRVLQYKPDQNIGFMNLAPGLLVNLEDIPAMGIVKPGSRVTWQQLYAGSDRALATFRERVEPQLRPDESVRGRESAGEQINTAIDRARRFLTLASLVTVILAAVAAAMAARRYVLRHLDMAALLKTLGATQGFVVLTTVLELLAIIAVTVAVGTLLGYGAQQGLAFIATQVLGVGLPAPSMRPVVLGLLTAATVVLGFALPHLARLGTTPPLRVLRRDLPAPRPVSTGTWMAAVTALAVMVLAIVRDPLLLVLVAGGLAATAAVCALIGWLLVSSLGRVRGVAGVAWRYGLANIARRGPESIVQIVAFGLGLMVLLLLGVVRNDVLTAWQDSLPDTAPNHFMINIEREQLPGIRAFLRERVGQEPHALPLIRGRLTTIRGVPAQEWTFPDPQGRNFLRREVNLTWSADLPDSNRISAGQWWGADYSGSPQVSLEAEMAGRLGVGLGDRLGFNVGGEDIEAEVTSLRTVAWDSFQPNFFVVLSPGVAEDLPQTWLASIHVPPGQVEILGPLVRAFPGVTVLDLQAVLSQVRAVMNRASLAVQYVFMFTLAAGVVVLLAAVQLTRDERRFESAILHTLGAPRRQILLGVAVEFLVLGALAGILAALGASAVGWGLATYAFRLDYGVSGLLWLLAPVLGALIVGVTGTLATRSAVNEPPVTVLREG